MHEGWIGGRGSMSENNPDRGKVWRYWETGGDVRISENRRKGELRVYRANDWVVDAKPEAVDKCH